MLKNILSLLLSKFYSKQESELVGHQAMPSGSVITLVDNGTIGSDWTNSAFSGIAPGDGYLTFSGTSTSDVPIVGIGAGRVSASLTYPWTGSRISASIPIAKGATWNVQGSSMKDVVIIFISCIGGGVVSALKNALLQGGGPCLNSLSSSLRRSSLSVRRHGSATSLRPSYQGARKSPLPLTPILKTTQRRATELYVSIHMALRGQSSALLLVAGGSYFTARTKQEFIKRLRFLSQRVKRSTLISQRIKAPLVSSSLRPSVLNEVKGGASC